jgi:hypothetical protein
VRIASSFSRLGSSRSPYTSEKLVHSVAALAAKLVLVVAKRRAGRVQALEDLLRMGATGEVTATCPSRWSPSYTTACVVLLLGEQEPVDVLVGRHPRLVLVVE